MTEREQFERVVSVPGTMIRRDEASQSYVSVRGGLSMTADTYNDRLRVWQAARATPALPHPKPRDMRKVVEYLQEGIRDATQCEGWDQDDDFARAAHYAIGLLDLPRTAPALPQGVEEWMPILGTCLAIPMKLLDESQAKSNHGQTPARLKERGGISLSEAVAIAGKMKWRSLESKRALEILHDLSGMAIVPVRGFVIQKGSDEYNEIVVTGPDLGMQTFWPEDAAYGLMKAMLAAAKEQGAPIIKCEICGRAGITKSREKHPETGALLNVSNCPNCWMSYCSEEDQVAAAKDKQS